MKEKSFRGRTVLTIAGTLLLIAALSFAGLITNVSKAHAAAKNDKISQAGTTHLFQEQAVPLTVIDFESGVAIPFVFTLTGNLRYTGGYTPLPIISNTYQDAGVTGGNSPNLPFSMAADSWTEIYDGNGNYYATIYVQDANNCFYNTSDVVYCGDNFNTFTIPNGPHQIVLKHYMEGYPYNGSATGGLTVSATHIAF